MKANAETKARLLFALVLGVLAIAGALWYFSGSLRYNTFLLETHEPVSGLIADAPVEFRGVLVGRVKEVELVDPSNVRVLLSLRREAPVSAATVATITSRGLATHGFTGYVYVSLDDEGSDRRPLAASAGQDYPVIRTAPSRTMNLDLAVDLLTRKVDVLLDPRTVAALQQSADSLQRVSKSLETQVLPGAQKTMTRLDDLSTSVTGAAEKFRRDPSVVLHGTARRTPGPGEEK